MLQPCYPKSLDEYKYMTILYITLYISYVCDMYDGWGLHYTTLCEYRYVHFEQCFEEHRAF